MKNKKRYQALKGVAICTLDNMPMMVVVGNKLDAKEYVNNETSLTEDSVQYYDIKIVVKGS